jgi:hypothetical protein
LGVFSLFSSGTFFLFCFSFLFELSFLLTNN